MANPKKNGCDELRIILFTVGELFGGVERHVLSLCTDLKRREMSPLLVLLNDGELAGKARRARLETVVLAKSWIYDPQPYRELKEVIAEIDPRVLHVHGYQASVYAALAGCHRQCAIVATCHGRIEGSWKEPLSNLKSKAYEVMELAAVQRMRATICYVTRDLQARFAARHGNLERNVIYNGIDDPVMHGFERPVEYRSDCLNLACVGRLSEIKGLEFAIRSMAHPDMPKNARLSIIGTGPLAAQLEAEAARLDVGHRVQFLGFRDNIMDYIGSCDALLMPSLYEGLPYTLLEAMALGIPVVASRVGGLAEVLVDRKTAVLIPPGNAGEIAAAIRWITEHPRAAREIGASAQMDQRMRFSLERMSSSYLSVYRQALGGHRAGSASDS